MIDGQVVTNETETNLSVNAWSEDAEGKIVNTIPANGTDTKLIVTFDGEQLNYVSSSGSASEYKFIPKNPEKGDTNTHVLHIYAEDAFGPAASQSTDRRDLRYGNVRSECADFCM